MNKSSVKWRQFRLGVNVLTYCIQDGMDDIPRTADSNLIFMYGNYWILIVMILNYFHKCPIDNNPHVQLMACYRKRPQAMFWNNNHII